MCGRYFFQLDEGIAERWHTSMAEWDFQQGEIFPGQRILTLRQGNDGQPSLQVFHWGIHGYQGKLLINARSESLDQKMTFRPFMHRRCAILANGFYEWTKRGSVKEKIYIRREDEQLIYLAGIYNHQGECVILTGAAQREMAQIHSRTPLIMKETAMRAYLSQQLGFVVDNEHLLYEAV